MMILNEKKIMYSSNNFANYGNRCWAKSLGKTLPVFEILATKVSKNIFYTLMCA